MRTGRGGAPLLAVVLLLLAQWEIWTGQRGPAGDAALFHQPYQMLVGDFARHGALLQWNPWTNGGSPDGAEPQVGAHSPFAVLCGLLGGGTPWSFVLLWLGSWGLTAAGMAMWSRHLGAPRWAQVALALAWAGNGVFTGHSMHTCFLHAFAWLPWILLHVDRALLAVGRARLWHAAAAGGCWGLAALAGYPGVVAVVGMLAGGWIVLRTLTTPAPTAHPAEVAPRPALRQWGAAAVVLATFAGVALVVLAPTYAAFFIEGSGFTVRTASLTRGVASGWDLADPGQANPLELRCLWTLCHPGLAARAVDTPGLFQATDPSSVGLDQGLGCLILAGIGLAAARRRALAWGVLLLGLLFLGTALGSTLPLRAWLFDLVPPTRYFRHPAIFRIGLLFALATLAALGARDLTLRLLARAAGVAALLGAGTAALAHRVLGLPVLPAEWLWLVAVHGLAAVVAVLAHRQRERLAHLGLAAVFAVGFVASMRLQAPLFTSDTARSDLLAREHRDSIDLGAAGFARRLCAATVPQAQQDAVLAGRLGELVGDGRSLVGALFDNANLPSKQPVLYGYAALNNGFHFSLAGSPQLLAQAIGAQRTFFAATAVHVARGAAEYDAFAAEVARSGHVPLVVHDDGPAPVDLAAAVAAARLRPLPSTVRSYRPDALELELEPQPGAGWLLVTERWARGWRAEVDGQPVAVLPAGFLWRAVRLPAGAQRVTFAYRLAGQPWLLLLSWVTLAALLSWSWRRPVGPTES